MGLTDIFPQLRRTLQLKFVKDTIWVVASYVVLGASGIAVNTVLVGFYGEGAFGHFALAFSLYMLLHMVAVMGVNNSVIKYVAERAEDDEHTGSVITGGLLVVAGSASVITLGAWLASPLVATVYEPPAVLAIYKVMLLGLPLFAVNKVLVGLLNGLRDMTAYAMFQASRYVLVLGGVLAVAIGGGSLVECAWAVPAAEVVLLAGLAARTRLPRRLRLRGVLDWCRRHLVFGFLSSLHDVAVELYFRVDILIVGRFDERMLGLYAYASDVAKGLTAFSILVQVNFNPIISRLWSSQQVDALGDYMRRVRRSTYLMYLPVLVLAAVGYPALVYLFRSEMLVWQHLVSFYILLAGVVLFSGYSALLGSMAYTGHLNAQVRRSLYALAVNTVGSLTLVPLIGIIGAAVSTLVTFLLLAGTTHVFIRRRLGIALWP